MKSLKPVCKFNDVLETNMDFLFLEEFVSSPDFLKLFLSKVNIKSGKVLEIEQSKTHSELGESDITLIIETDNKRHGLLIENKIDATAMPEQYRRYVARGKVGIKNGDYESFDVFIVAPKKYLDSNAEAQKYPNKVEYEECANYFKSCSDTRSFCKLQQIEYAINKQKTPYQPIENIAVTDFWDKYIAYQQQRYPNLWLRTSGGSKGSRADWPRFRVHIKGIYILHKSEFGYVDLTFPNCADKTVELKNVLTKYLGNLNKLGVTVQQTGKSAALRVIVPKLDFKLPFDEYVTDVETCFKGISKLTALSEKMPVTEITELIKNK